MKKIWSGIRSIINISKVKADYIPSILESGKLLIIPVLLLTFLIISLLMWVKTLTKTFRVGSAVQPLFWRAIFLTQCFSPLLLQLKLIHIYLNISVPLLKILKTHISPLISSLINDSFLCGIFPSKLKWAKVIPVFKKGSRQDKDNYRLISVLSTFSKIFEKAVFKRLYGYLESRNILYPLQFGFRGKSSTNHGLIQITESNP